MKKVTFLFFENSLEEMEGCLDTSYVLTVTRFKMETFECKGKTIVYPSYSRVDFKNGDYSYILETPEYLFPELIQKPPF